MTTIAMKNLARDMLVATSSNAAIPRVFTQAEIRLIAKEFLEQDDQIRDLEKRLRKYEAKKTS